MRICQGTATTERLFNHTITRQLISKTRALSSGILGALQLVKIKLQVIVKAKYNRDLKF